MLRFKYTAEFKGKSFMQIQAECEKYIREELRGLTDKQAKAVGYRCEVVDFR